MKYWSKTFRKIIAGGLCFVFLLSGQMPFAYSKPAKIDASTNARTINVQNFDAVQVPSNFGEVTESHLAGKKTIILIQDAHEVPDAQKNIHALIRYFEKNYGVKSVAVEGSSTKLDAQIFRSFPDKKQLKQTFTEYYDRAELSGAAAASVFSGSDVEFQGVEDWELYEEALLLFLSALDNESVMLEKLNQDKRVLNQEKLKVYSKQFLEVDRKVEEFFSNAAELPELLRVLQTIRDPKEGGLLEVLIEEISKSKSSNIHAFNQDIEIRQVAKQIDEILSSRPVGVKKLNEVTKAFNSKKQAWQTGELSSEAFGLYLGEISNELNIDFELSQSLNQGIQSQKRLKQIEGTKLLEELELYINQITAQVISSEPQKAQQKLWSLVRKTEELRLLTKLSKLELSRREWDQLSSDGSLREGQFSLNHDFYVNATLREDAFFKKLNQLENDVSIFVAGGFHTGGMINRLKEAGLSYILVTPRINQIPEKSMYRQHMTGDVSWKAYFEEENGRVKPYDAFIRGVRDELLNQTVSNPYILKAWRDEVVRDLADQSRTHEAWKYTKFLDEKVHDEKYISSRFIHEGITQRLSRRVEQFLSGLRVLNTEGNLTQSNTAKLLQTMNAVGGWTGTAAWSPNASLPLKPQLVEARSESRASQEMRYEDMPQMGDELIEMFLEKVRNISVLAAPGAGKGTLMKSMQYQINEYLDRNGIDGKYEYLEIGEYYRGVDRLVRGQAKKGDEEKYRKFVPIISSALEKMRAGLITENETLELVNLALEQPEFRDAKGIFFDGFPRTDMQQEAIEDSKILYKEGPLSIDLYSVLEVSESKRWARVQLRDEQTRELRIDSSMAIEQKIRKFTQRMKDFEELTLPLIISRQDDNATLTVADDVPEGYDQNKSIEWMHNKYYSELKSHLFEKRSEVLEASKREKGFLEPTELDVETIQDALQAVFPVNSTEPNKTLILSLGWNSSRKPYGALATSPGIEGTTYSHRGLFNHFDWNDQPYSSVVLSKNDHQLTAQVFPPHGATRKSPEMDSYEEHLEESLRLVIDWVKILGKTAFPNQELRIDFGMPESWEPFEAKFGKELVGEGYLIEKVIEGLDAVAARSESRSQSPTVDIKIKGDLSWQMQFDQALFEKMGFKAKGLLLPADQRRIWQIIKRGNRFSSYWLGRDQAIAARANTFGTAGPFNPKRGVIYMLDNPIIENGVEYNAVMIKGSLLNSYKKGEIEEMNPFSAGQPTRFFYMEKGKAFYEGTARRAYGGISYSGAQDETYATNRVSFPTAPLLGEGKLLNKTFSFDGENQENLGISLFLVQAKPTALPSTASQIQFVEMRLRDALDQSILPSLDAFFESGEKDFDQDILLPQSLDRVRQYIRDYGQLLRRVHQDGYHGFLNLSNVAVWGDQLIARDLTDFRFWSEIPSANRVGYLINDLKVVFDSLSTNLKRNPSAAHLTSGYPHGGSDVRQAYGSIMEHHGATLLLDFLDGYFGDESKVDQFLNIFTSNRTVGTKLVLGRDIATREIFAFMASEMRQALEVIGADDATTRGHELIRVIEDLTSDVTAIKYQGSRSESREQVALGEAIVEAHEILDSFIDSGNQSIVPSVKKKKVRKLRADWIQTIHRLMVWRSQYYPRDKFNVELEYVDSEGEEGTIQLGDLNNLFSFPPQTFDLLYPKSYKIAKKKREEIVNYNQSISLSEALELLPKKTSNVSHQLTQINRMVKAGGYQIMADLRLAGKGRIAFYLAGGYKELPFSVEEPHAYDSLALKVNGVEIAREQNHGVPTDDVSSAISRFFSSRVNFTDERSRILSIEKELQSVDHPVVSIFDIDETLLTVGGQPKVKNFDKLLTALQVDEHVAGVITHRAVFIEEKGKPYVTKDIEDYDEVDREDMLAAIKQNEKFHEVVGDLEKVGVAFDQLDFFSFGFFYAESSKLGLYLRVKNPEPAEGELDYFEAVIPVDNPQIGASKLISAKLIHSIYVEKYGKSFFGDAFLMMVGDSLLFDHSMMREGAEGFVPRHNPFLEKQQAYVQSDASIPSESLFPKGMGSIVIPIIKKGKESGEMSVEFASSGQKAQSVAFSDELMTDESLPVVDLSTSILQVLRHVRKKPQTTVITIPPLTKRGGDSRSESRSQKSRIGIYSSSIILAGVLSLASELQAQNTLPSVHQANRGELLVDGGQIFSDGQQDQPRLVETSPTGKRHYKMSTGESIDSGRHGLLSEDTLTILNGQKQSFGTTTIQGGQCCFVMAHPNSSNKPLALAHFYPGLLGSFKSPQETEAYVDSMVQALAQNGITPQKGVFHLIANGPSDQPFANIISNHLQAHGFKPGQIRIYDPQTSRSFMWGLNVEGRYKTNSEGKEILEFEVFSGDGILKTDGDNIEVGVISEDGSTTLIPYVADPWAKFKWMMTFFIGVPLLIWIPRIIYHLIRNLRPVTLMGAFKMTGRLLVDDFQSIKKTLTEPDSESGEANDEIDRSARSESRLSDEEKHLLKDAVEEITLSKLNTPHGNTIQSVWSTPEFDPSFPYVVKIPRGVNLKRSDYEESLAGLGGLMAPTTILENVNFNGAVYPWLIIQKRMIVPSSTSSIALEDEIPNQLSWDAYHFKNLSEREKEFWVIAAKRGYLFNDPMQIRQIGFDPETGKMFLVDHMNATPVASKSAFHKSISPKNYGREVSGEHFFVHSSVYAYGSHFDEIKMPTDDELYDMWGRAPPVRVDDVSLRVKAVRSESRIIKPREFNLPDASSLQEEDFLIFSPIYNEELGLKESIQRAREGGYIQRVIFVDDASTDGSLDLLKNEDVFYISYPQNQKKEGSVVAAIRDLQQLKEYIPTQFLILDSDSHLRTKKGASVLDELRNIIRNNEGGIRGLAIEGRVRLDSNLVEWVEALHWNLRMKVRLLIEFLRQPYLVFGAGSLLNTNDFLKWMNDSRTQEFESGDIQLSILAADEGKQSPSVSTLIAVTDSPKSFIELFQQQLRLAKATIQDQPAARWFITGLFAVTFYLMIFQSAIFFPALAILGLYLTGASVFSWVLWKMIHLISKPENVQFSFIRDGLLLLPLFVMEQFIIAFSTFAVSYVDYYLNKLSDRDLPQTQETSGKGEPKKRLDDHSELRYRVDDIEFKNNQLKLFTAEDQARLKQPNVALGLDDINALLEKFPFDHKITLSQNRYDRSNINIYASTGPTDVLVMKIELVLNDQEKGRLSVGADTRRQDVLQYLFEGYLGDSKWAAQNVTPAIIEAKDSWLPRMEKWATSRGFKEVVFTPIEATMKNPQNIFVRNGYIYDESEHLYVKDISRSENRYQKIKDIEGPIESELFVELEVYNLLEAEDKEIVERVLSLGSQAPNMGDLAARGIRPVGTSGALGLKRAIIVSLSKPIAHDDIIYNAIILKGAMLDPSGGAEVDPLRPESAGQPTEYFYVSDGRVSFTQADIQARGGLPWQEAELETVATDLIKAYAASENADFKHLVAYLVGKARISNKHLLRDGRQVPLGVELQLVQAQTTTDIYGKSVYEETRLYQVLLQKILQVQKLSLQNKPLESESLSKEVLRSLEETIEMFRAFQKIGRHASFNLTNIAQWNDGALAIRDLTDFKKWDSLPEAGDRFAYAFLDFKIFLLGYAALFFESSMNAANEGMQDYDEGSYFANQFGSEVFEVLINTFFSPKNQSKARGVFAQYASSGDFEALSRHLHEITDSSDAKLMESDIPLLDLLYDEWENDLNLPARSESRDQGMSDEQFEWILIESDIFKQVKKEILQSDRTWNEKSRDLRAIADNFVHKVVEKFQRDYEDLPPMLFAAGGSYAALGGELAPHSDYDGFVVVRTHDDVEQVKDYFSKQGFIYEALQSVGGWNLFALEEFTNPVSIEDGGTGRTTDPEIPKEVMTMILSSREVVSAGLLHNELRTLLEKHLQKSENQTHILKQVLGAWESNRSGTDNYFYEIFELEPDLKWGAGGLKDYDQARWVIRIFYRDESHAIEGGAQSNIAFLTEQEFENAKNAVDFIREVRWRLHELQPEVTAESHVDRLALRFHLPIARAMVKGNLSDSDKLEEFFTRLRSAQRALYRYTTTILRRGMHKLGALNYIPRDETDSQKYLFGGSVEQVKRYGTAFGIEGKRVIDANNPESSLTLAINQDVRIEDVPAIFQYAAENQLTLTGELLDGISSSTSKKLGPHVLASGYRTQALNSLLQVLSLEKPVGYYVDRMYSHGMLGVAVTGFNALYTEINSDFKYHHTLDIKSIQDIKILDAILGLSTDSPYFDLLDVSELQESGLLAAMRIFLLTQELFDGSKIEAVHRAYYQGLGLADKQIELILWLLRTKTALFSLIRNGGIYVYEDFVAFQDSVTSHAGGSPDYVKWQALLAMLMVRLKSFQPQRLATYRKRLEPILQMTRAEFERGELLREFFKEKIISPKLPNFAANMEVGEVRTRWEPVEGAIDTWTVHVAYKKHPDFLRQPGRLFRVLTVMTGSSFSIQALLPVHYDDENVTINSLVVYRKLLTLTIEEDPTFQPKLEAKIDEAHRESDDFSVRSKFRRIPFFRTPSDLTIPETKTIIRKYGDASFVYIETPDGVGALADIAHILSMNGLLLGMRSTIDTVGGIAAKQIQDTIHVIDTEGLSPTDQQMQNLADDLEFAFSHQEINNDVLRKVQARVESRRSEARELAEFKNGFDLFRDFSMRNDGSVSVQLFPDHMFKRSFLFAGKPDYRSFDRFLKNFYRNALGKEFEGNHAFNPDEWSEMSQWLNEDELNEWQEIMKKLQMFQERMEIYGLMFDQKLPDTQIQIFAGFQIFNTDPENDLEAISGFHALRRRLTTLMGAVIDQKMAEIEGVELEKTKDQNVTAWAKNPAEIAGPFEVYESNNLEDQSDLKQRRINLVADLAKASEANLDDYFSALNKFMAFVQPQIMSNGFVNDDVEYHVSDSFILGLSRALAEEDVSKRPERLRQLISALNQDMPISSALYAVFRSGVLTWLIEPLAELEGHYDKGSPHQYFTTRHLLQVVDSIDVLAYQPYENTEEPEAVGALKLIREAFRRIQAAHPYELGSFRFASVIHDAAKAEDESTHGYGMSHMQLGALKSVPVIAHDLQLSQSETDLSARIAWLHQHLNASIRDLIAGRKTAEQILMDYINRPNMTPELWDQILLISVADFLGLFYAPDSFPQTLVNMLRKYGARSISGFGMDTTLFGTSSEIDHGLPFNEDHGLMRLVKLHSQVREVLVASENDRLDEKNKILDRIKKSIRQEDGKFIAQLKSEGVHDDILRSFPVSYLRYLRYLRYESDNRVKVLDQFYRGINFEADQLRPEVKIDVMSLNDSRYLDVWVVVPEDKVGVLSIITAILSGNRLDIHDATTQPLPNGVVFNHFRVQAFGDDLIGVNPAEIIDRISQQVREELNFAFSGARQAPSKWFFQHYRNKKRPYNNSVLRVFDEQEIKVFAEISAVGDLNQATRFVFNGINRPYLLSDFMRIVSEGLGLSVIQSPQIHNYQEFFRDEFVITSNGSSLSIKEKNILTEVAEELFSKESYTILELEEAIAKAKSMRSESRKNDPVRENTKKLLTSFLTSSVSLTAGEIENQSRVIPIAIESLGFDQYAEIVEEIRDEFLAGLEGKQLQQMENVIEFVVEALRSQSDQTVKVGLDDPSISTDFESLISRVSVGSDLHLVVAPSMRDFRMKTGDGIIVETSGALKSRRDENALMTLAGVSGEQASTLNKQIVDMLSEGNVKDFDSLLSRRTDVLMRFMVAALLSGKIKDQSVLENQEKRAQIFAEMGYFGNIIQALEFNQGTITVQVSVLFKLAQDFAATRQVQMAA